MEKYYSIKNVCRKSKWSLSLSESSRFFGSIYILRRAEVAVIKRASWPKITHLAVLFQKQGFHKILSLAQVVKVYNSSSPMMFGTKNIWA
ncbi:unnamed protein product [Dovyalis caffra]|uniref:Uncharacterized protein n=1 Tax=Dovyalis caffra TaxID=77055 RepID=A0AAV1RTF3_9ROSI|nr:unnamed protein product [Dovyalis caffra]